MHQMLPMDLTHIAMYNQPMPTAWQPMPITQPNISAPPRINDPVQRIPDPSLFSASALEGLQIPQDKITKDGIIPEAPYYQLPAGLMVPLVSADDTTYRPLKPTDLRLPLPRFPDANFMQLIDSYYRPDSNSRDNDGWDRSFLDVYLKQKAALAEMKSQSST